MTAALALEVPGVVDVARKVELQPLPIRMRESPRRRDLF